MAIDQVLRRHRSSTSKTNIAPLHDSTQKLIQCINSINQLAGDATYDDTQVSPLENIYDLFLRIPDAEELQDQFRRHHGFQTILAYLNRRLSGQSQTLGPLIHDLCRILAILSFAFRNHDGNRRYFSRKVERGGWAALADVVASAQARLADDQDATLALTTRLVRSLFALAISEGTFDGFYESSDPENGSHAGIADMLKPMTRINLPQALPILIRICTACISDITRYLRLDVLTTLNTLATRTPGDANLIAEGDSTSSLVQHFLIETLPADEATVLQSLVPALLQHQCGPLEYVQRLVSLASANSKVRHLLESATSGDKQAPCIQFDLSRVGHASLEIPCLPRAFPPPNGYTLAAWVRVDEFDPAHHTTIFGAFDASQTCFILAYIEQASHQLILQTSITSTNPSVRFKRFRFKVGSWYHIAIVQHPPKSGQFGEAVLYVNGRWVERRDACLYPLAPPQPSLNNLAPFSPNTHDRRPVQAFFGTPRDLAMNVNDNLPKSRWSLATARLYDLCLSPDHIAVQHALGPAYSGNLQDRVGQLLTYDSSATLNRFNDEIHGAKAEQSSIVRYTQQPGSDLLHEGSHYLTIFPSATVQPDHDIASQLSSQIRFLPETAAKQLSQITRTGNTIVFNACRPLLADALARPYGVAVLAGATHVCIPQTLDDAVWRLSGFVACHIMLLESASTADELLSAVRTLCHTIKHNFRACEAMEREHGYSIVALLLHEKLGFAASNTPSKSNPRSIPLSSHDERDSLIVSILETLLAFVGVSMVDQRPMLSNAMAYRSLLIDLDTWRVGSIASQKIFYQQFCWLLGHDDNHKTMANPNIAFNAKRLLKMRSLRKLIDCLRSDIVFKDNCDVVLRAFRLLLINAAGKNDHRDIATFVGFCLHEGRGGITSSRPQRSMTIRLDIPQSAGQQETSPAGQPRSTTSLVSSGTALSKAELGTLILQEYADVLCDPDSAHILKRFHRNVPISWLLHLLGDEDPEVAEAAFRLMSRCIVAMGPDYVSRLASKNAGLSIVRDRIQRHFRRPRMWWYCFSALSGVNIVSTSLLQSLAQEQLVQAFPPATSTVRHPECLSWVFAMVDYGLSGSLEHDPGAPGQDKDAGSDTLQVALGFICHMHRDNQAFRQLTGSAQYLKELLRIAYPSIADASILTAKSELESMKSDPEGAKDVTLRPHASSISSGRPAIIRSGSSATFAERPASRRIRAPRRPSSFVLVEADGSTEIRLSAHFSAVMAPAKGKLPDTPLISSAADMLLDIFVGNLIDQACLRREFTGFGLFLKVPPSDKVHQAYFSSYVLLRTMTNLWTHLSANEALLQSPRTLTNLAKYSLHMAEAVFEGWFMDGAQPLVDFTGKLLDYVQRPDVAVLKDVRLCSQAISTIRTVFLRIVLLRLSELDESESDAETLRFIEQLNYWQTILFAPENQEIPFIRLICYVLYTKLVSSSPPVRMASAALFRMLLVLKPTEAATILVHGAEGSQKHLSTGFMKLATHNDEELLHWVDERRQSLDKFFLDTLSAYWEDFVDSENRKTEDSAKLRLAKRKEELQRWQKEETNLQGYLDHARQATGHWQINSHAQDRTKLNRSLQDQQETISFHQAAIARQHELMQQPCGMTPDQTKPKWQLDRTESRDRMRVRLIRDKERETHEYQPKGKLSERVVATLERDRAARRSVSAASHGSSKSNGNGIASNDGPTAANAQAIDTGAADDQSGALLEGDFELVDDPQEEIEAYEDKNRKIMRSVERGDSIKSVYNVSRIVGLEACEGLLIIGRNYLYMRDHLFHRSDHEIVAVNNAPPEERDAYVQMISGRELRTSKGPRASGSEDLARSWAWKDVISMSKRRFLFRSVAIEVFFNDGRSYLLVFADPRVRDNVYNDSVRQAPHITGSASSMSEEDQWRLESIRGPEDIPASFGNKFASVFNSAAGSSATKKWQRGEVSNFNYLMLVNTMAGRTFNDLTQYPVFPWVLADYSSEELDLDDPRSFRDLSKPMGCQNPAREAEFRERYQTFAEMGDEKPFHYGTHYSSAMIVTSYLIRLQPFVQSYLLLQGGSFDHADRLFDSIEKAWLGSSKQNMTDVRELTPEFYYLPEFLTNLNDYDFGIKQGSGQAIGDVHLPKWAKGDPHLFIKKHREALESPYVSEHLHEWIDLIFGFKQKGEAAVEATNVFHPLSYHGAKDLDSIDDPMERLATIGIIHNFGQTPHQVFARPHAQREQERYATPRLDTQADTLTKLPKPAAEISERVAHILLSNGRVLASGPCKTHASPNGRFFAQWQYADNSLRFFDTESRKLLGLSEELHIGALSAVHFLDAKTLFTAGVDCTIGVWDVPSSTDRLELRPRQYLFGHRAPVVHIATSKVFSTLVSADSDGRVIMWDLNRFDCVRILAEGKPVSAVAISGLTGYVALASGSSVAVQTINGHVLLDQRLAEPDDPVACLAWYSGHGAEWVGTQLLFTGHRRSVVRVWALVTLADGSWHLQLVRHLCHADPAREGVAGYVPPGVTAVLAHEKGVVVGDESGTVWEYSCVTRHWRR